MVQCSGVYGLGMSVLLSVRVAVAFEPPKMHMGVDERRGCGGGGGHAGGS